MIRNRRHSNIAHAHGIKREVVFESCVESQVFDKEKQLIAFHKTYAYDHDCWGANYTLGGEGTSGAKLPWTPERRKAASIIQKQTFKNPLRYKQHVDATKKQWHDQNRRAAQSLRMKLQNPSHTHPDTSETRKRKSLGQKRRFTNPDERQRMSELTRKSCLRSDVFEKRSLAQRVRRQRERDEKR